MSYYYTMTMIPSSNDSHPGFWLITVGLTVAMILSASFFAAIDRNPPWKELGMISFFLVVLVIVPTGVGSFFMKDIEPLNEPVRAQLLSSYELEERTTGKHPRNVMNAYVTYMVDDGEVAFSRSVGVVYPKEIIVYKQRRNQK